MKKFALVLIILSLVCTILPTSKIYAKSDIVIEPKGYIEQVISSYETVYNKSPYVKLYDENFVYKTITFNRTYSYTVEESVVSTLEDTLKGYIRRRYVYKYTLN